MCRRHGVAGAGWALLLLSSAFLTRTASAFLTGPHRYSSLVQHGKSAGLCRVKEPARVFMSSATAPDSQSQRAGKSNMLPVVLGPYKDGAITLTVKRPTVSEQAVEAMVQAAAKKRFKLVPVRFVEEGGTKMGHTVVCDWKATYLRGGSPEAHKLRPGVVLPGADIKGFTLELKEDQSEPLASFARAVATGMGQMETKAFEVTFPESVKVEAWRGVTANVMLLVRSINRKEDLPEDPRPLDERREQARKDLMAKAEAEADAEILAGFKAALLESCDADTDKIVNSVSWAKFGERSLKDFKFQLIQEAIASAEGIDFHQVPAFLRAHNTIEFTD